jgi:hypothetical protein
MGVGIAGIAGSSIGAVVGALHAAGVPGCSAGFAPVFPTMEFRGDVVNTDRFRDRWRRRTPRGGRTPLDDAGRAVVREQRETSGFDPTVHKG